MLRMKGHWVPPCISLENSEFKVILLIVVLSSLFFRRAALVLELKTVVPYPIHTHTPEFS